MPSVTEQLLGSELSPAPRPATTSRHEGLIAPGLIDLPIWVIGCGTIGSWVIHNLIRLGFRDIVAWDFDRVGPENIASQCFTMGDAIDPHDIQGRGIRKVHAISRLEEDVMTPVGGDFTPRVTTIASEFNRENYDGANGFDDRAIVISAVDSLEARRLIATKAAEAHVHRFIDFRMGALFGSVLFVGPMAWDSYFETLDVPFIEETECGARSFLPTAHFLVGIGMAHWFAIERGATRGRHRLNIDAVTGTVVPVREKATGE